MQTIRTLLLIFVFLGLALPASADTTTLSNGGDTFYSGAVLNEALTTSGDTFASGRTVNASGSITGDLHASGFDVTVSADATKDVYAAGGTVIIRGKTGEDLTVAAFSARTDASAVTGGNARLFAKTVTVEGPISGALTAMGQDVILNAPIEGDVRILAQSISFGPKAVVSGTLTYSTKEKITVPKRVAPAERVVFEKASASAARDGWDEFRKEMPGLPAFASLMFGFAVSLMFFVALGAVMLGFVPRRLEAMRQSIARAPGQSFMLGVIGLSMLFGMVPILALTIVGLPFVPVVLLLIVVAWTLGYALGAYSVAMRIWTGFSDDTDPSAVMRLLIFAAAITLIAMLNFIPFVGWVANYTLVLLGLGAMTNVVFRYMIGNPGEAFDIDMRPIED